MWKLFGWFSRMQLWATDDWQLHHDNAPTHASRLMQSVLVKHQITQVTQPPLQPRFGGLWPLAFPKTKITFEREDISHCQWDSGKYNRAAEGDWENCVKSQGAYFEEDSGVFVPCTMFLTSSSINVSIFHITWLGTFWTDYVCFSQNNEPGFSCLLWLNVCLLLSFLRKEVLASSALLTCLLPCF